MCRLDLVMLKSNIAILLSSKYCDIDDVRMLGCDLLVQSEDKQDKLVAFNRVYIIQ